MFDGMSFESCNWGHSFIGRGDGHVHIECNGCLSVRWHSLCWEPGGEASVVMSSLPSCDWLDGAVVLSFRCFDWSSESVRLAHFLARVSLGVI